MLHKAMAFPASSVTCRALNLGIQPNTVMYNTAISAAGKAGQLGVAEKLYAKVRLMLHAACSAPAPSSTDETCSLRTPHAGQA